MRQSEYRALRNRLRAGIIEEPFDLLGRIAGHYARADDEGDRNGRLLARELVIRCVERTEDLREVKELLDALVARAGLFPYLDAESLGFADRLVYESHRPLVPPAGRDAMVFHEAQAEVYARLMDGGSVVLSAPTSFGKSVIVDTLVASGRFTNIVIIVPTIALIDEVRRRLTRASVVHKIITHPSQTITSRNVFVLTQERALELQGVPRLDLLVVDEFYKLNLDQDGDRSVLLNQAVYRLLRQAKQFYLLGPNIRSLAELPARFRFYNLPSDDITVAVDVNRVELSARGDAAKEAALVELLRDNLSEQTLVYCSNPARATRVAQVIASTLESAGTQDASVVAAADWVADTYHPSWTLTTALRSGIGIHHGRIPRALAHWMVSAFNDGTLRFLVCTQTLIEGVNTSAKDVVVYDGIRNRATLDLFTYRNIQGRSGRMFRHFVGRVWLFGREPTGELMDVDIPVLTQPDDTPEGLLLEVDERDLTANSREKLSPYLDQDLVQLETLKANPGVALDEQLALAERLSEQPRYWAAQLRWRRVLFPTWDELAPILELMWEFWTPKRGAWGAGSPQQLTLLIRRLRKQYDPAALIESQVQYHRQRGTERTVDEIVLDVLSFLRSGANFVVPRYLRVINTLAADVLAAYTPGDISPFASALEGYFLPAPLAALDEYGLPPEVALRLADRLAPEGAADGLDETLDRLRGLPLGAVRGFERVLLREAQQDL
ncbi:MAG: helicase protein [Conexibacter sp.]|nr:helicase protein [Conexibacter sp.]